MMPWQRQLHRCQACCKWAYPSRREARRAYKAFHPGDRKLNAYRCPHDPRFWHYGHRPGCQGKPATTEPAGTASGEAGRSLRSENLPREISSS